MAGVDISGFNGAAPLLERRSRAPSRPHRAGTASTGPLHCWDLEKRLGQAAEWASTGPLHCWSGDLRNLSPNTWTALASTGPLHCWSGDRDISDCCHGEHRSFNGAAPLLERRSS